MSEFFRITNDGVVLIVGVIPGGSKDMVEGVITDDSGSSYVKVRVTAPPEKGKANKSMLKLLAKQLKIPISSMEIVSNEHARRKQILIRGDAVIIRELITNNFSVG